MMIKNIKIPEERLPIIIGVKGSTKRQIQRKTETKIKVDEEITIEGESLNVLDAENVIKAIGRGFSPDIAYELLKEDTAFSITELPRDARQRARIKSRLIGTGGKSRRNIERLTGTYVSVYGKTVCLIGKYENIYFAEQAIKKIIDGLPHRLVYEFLEGKQNELKKS